MIYVIGDIHGKKEKYLEIKNGVVSAITVIKDKVVEIYNKIKEIFQALWWAFKEYVWNPIVDKLTTFYKEKIEPIVNAVKDVFKKIGEWFKTYITDPIKKVFDWLMEKVIWVRDKAVEVLKKVGTTVVDFISNTFKNVINGVLWGVESAINGFIRLLNGAINIINKIPGVNITHVSTLSIPRLAEGGIVGEGQMFIAREAGAEMVGSMNGRTAVANNDQIVEGISQGVYSAVVAAMSQNNNNSSQSLNVYLDGKQITAAVEKRQRERGATIMTGGVTFGY